MPGPMAAVFGCTGTRRTPARASRGRLATPRVEGFVSRSRPCKAGGLSVGTVGKELGILRCSLSRQTILSGSPLGLLCHGERSLQDFFSSRVSCPDGRRVRFKVAQRG